MGKKKKKKKPLPPRRLRMNRQGRLHSAKSWIAGFHGKYLVRRYKNHYGLDWGTAIAELRMLGAKLDEAYVNQVLTGETARIKHLQRRREQKKLAAESWASHHSDETFASIIGYTEGGFAYGVTWDEWRAIEIDDEAGEKADGEELDLFGQFTDWLDIEFQEFFLNDENLGSLAAALEDEPEHNRIMDAFNDDAVGDDDDEIPF